MSFFDQWRYQGQCDRTFQSYVEKTHVSLLHHQEHVEFFTRLERFGDKVQSLVPRWSIKMAPVKVTMRNEEQVWKNLYAQRLNA